MADYSAEAIKKIMAERHNSIAVSDNDPMLTDRDTLMMEIRHFQSKVKFLQSENYAPKVMELLDNAEAALGAAEYIKLGAIIKDIKDFTKRFI